MQVDYSTFDRFIATTNGRSIGAGECWDYVNLIWSHLGHRYYTYPPSSPGSTNHGIKWGVVNMEARMANIIPHLTFIPTVSQLKRGDIVISTAGTYGHGGFINEDYSPNKTRYHLYTQNWAGRRSVALDTYTLWDFGGAFRFDAWNDTPPIPPTPPTPSSKSKFPWFIYAKQNRIRRSIM